MNIRYDDEVHATDDDGSPVCGTADIPAWLPESTDDAVNCWECESIIS